MEKEMENDIKPILGPRRLEQRRWGRMAQLIGQS